MSAVAALRSDRCPHATRRVCGERSKALPWHEGEEVDVVQASPLLVQY